MHLFAILIAVVISLLILFGTAGCSNKTTAESAAAPPLAAASSPTTAKSIKSMSQAEIEKMLCRIETSETPKTKQMGAMCYSMTPPPDRMEYVCPVCGEKTLYAMKKFEDSEWPSDEEWATFNAILFLEKELPACRREFEVVKKTTDLALALDESSFCKHCRPDAKKHELKLIVTYQDGKTTTSPIDHVDLLLLRDFFKGQLSYEATGVDIYPIKEAMPRLRGLLGLTRLQEILELTPEKPTDQE